MQIRYEISPARGKLIIEVFHTEINSDGDDYEDYDTAVIPLKELAEALMPYLRNNDQETCSHDHDQWSEG